MGRILLSKITTNGELGTLANLEMHNIGKLGYLTGYDQLLDSLLDGGLPKGAIPSGGYIGETRIIVTTDQGILEKGKSFYLRARVLSESAEMDVAMHWRKLGQKKYLRIPMTRITRNVFECTFNAKDIPGDFEYFIIATAVDGEKCYPATAREINKTVVILE